MIRLRDKDGKVYLNDEEKATIPMIPNDYYYNVDNTNSRSKNMSNEYSSRSIVVQEVTCNNLGERRRLIQ